MQADYNERGKENVWYQRYHRCATRSLSTLSGGTTTALRAVPDERYYHYSLPVKIADLEQQYELVKLVDKAMSIKQMDFKADIQSTENEIDLLVYHLYGLTYDEVLIVDPETPITREEYETYPENK